MGDGAGMLVQIPHAFFVKEMAKQGVTLPEPGKYAVAHIFMPQDAALRIKMEKVVEKVIEDEGQTVLGWRDVPHDNSSLSKAPEIVATEPYHRQVVIGRGSKVADDEAFERKLYIIRKASGHAIRGPSFLIWQEERAEAESWARDLLPLRSAPRRVRRRPPGREA